MRCVENKCYFRPAGHVTQRVQQFLAGNGPKTLKGSPVVHRTTTIASVTRYSSQTGGFRLERHLGVLVHLEPTPSFSCRLYGRFSAQNELC